MKIWCRYGDARYVEPLAPRTEKSYPEVRFAERKREEKEREKKKNKEKKPKSSQASNRDEQVPAHHCIDDLWLNESDTTRR